MTVRLSFHYDCNVNIPIMNIYRLTIYVCIRLQFHNWHSHWSVAWKQTAKLVADGYYILLFPQTICVDNKCFEGQCEMAFEAVYNLHLGSYLAKYQHTMGFRIASKAIFKWIRVDHFFFYCALMVQKWRFFTLIFIMDSHHKSRTL